jgi:hypothetical protein
MYGWMYNTPKRQFRTTPTCTGISFLMDTQAVWDVDGPCNQLHGDPPLKTGTAPSTRLSTCQMTNDGSVWQLPPHGGEFGEDCGGRQGHRSCQLTNMSLVIRVTCRTEAASGRKVSTWGLTQRRTVQPVCGVGLNGPTASSNAFEECKLASGQKLVLFGYYIHCPFRPSLTISSVRADYPEPNGTRQGHVIQNDSRTLGHGCADTTVNSLV